MASVFPVPSNSPQCLPLPKPSWHISLKDTAYRSQPPAVQSRSAGGQEIDLRVKQTRTAKYLREALAHPRQETWIRMF